ncbi:hypothetical protein B1F79_03575 [Coxiella-like endosymbiont of Rhipicephalus sanguineus]|uniref:SDR family NAD(P)-dependent oxidoreductase n=1 Tax=Coxiella-like endosymbiont of Rhipicephalus sanguineus TaxID=1955402 RepID=UPI003557AC5E|nr:hypothetical protein [Coxiella-like endosymbiont of Rhipicephalus sanguineus]
MIQLDLSRKCALVCDAPKGIGKACVEALAELSCEVVVLAYNENALKTVISSLPKNMLSIILTYAQIFLLSNLDVLRRIIIQEINSNVAIEILINNAGGLPPGPILEQLMKSLKLILTSIYVLIYF